MMPRTLSINMTGGDPDIAPSIEHTPASFQNTWDWPTQIRVHNSLKRGLLMSYWTCIAIARDGIYDVDVRAFPGITEAEADEHGNALGISANEQREVALRLIATSFGTLAGLLAWLAEQLHSDNPAVMQLHRWEQVAAHENAQRHGSGAAPTMKRTAEMVQQYLTRGQMAREIVRLDALLEAATTNTADRADAVRYRTIFEAGMLITLYGARHVQKATLDAALDDLSIRLRKGAAV